MAITPGSAYVIVSVSYNVGGVIAILSLVLTTPNPGQFGLGWLILRSWKYIAANTFSISMIPTLGIAGALIHGRRNGNANVRK